MAEITAKMVMSLRAKTDAPMMDCKKALSEAMGCHSCRRDTESSFRKQSLKSINESSSRRNCCLLH